MRHLLRRRGRRRLCEWLDRDVRNPVRAIEDPLPRDARRAPSLYRDRAGVGVRRERPTVAPLRRRSVLGILRPPPVSLRVTGRDSRNARAWPV